MIRFIPQAVALAFALALTVPGIASSLAHALAPPSPLESALEARGMHVERLAGSLLPFLASADDGSAIILVEPMRLFDAEKQALRKFVEKGGDAWIVAESTRDFLWDEAAGSVATQTGVLYDASGSAALVQASDGEMFPVAGALSIEIDGSDFTPYLSTTDQAFRDTTANGQIDNGEPAGPFIVAARLSAGEGTLTWIGSAEPTRTASAVAAHLPVRAERVVLQDHAHASSWAAPLSIPLILFSLPAGSALAIAMALLLSASALLLFLAEPRPASEQAALAMAREEIEAYRKRTAAAPAERASNPAEPGASP